MLQCGISTSEQRSISIYRSQRHEARARDICVECMLHRHAIHMRDVKQIICQEPTERVRVLHQRAARSWVKPCDQD
jgi:hypothetical protein